VPSLVGVEGAVMAQIIPISTFTVTALIAGAQRELDLRRQVYWSRVRAGQMRQADADARIALMAAIVRRLTATAAQWANWPPIGRSCSAGCIPQPSWCCGI